MDEVHIDPNGKVYRRVQVVGDTFHLGVPGPNRLGPGERWVREAPVDEAGVAQSVERSERREGQLSQPADLGQQAIGVVGGSNPLPGASETEVKN